MTGTSNRISCFCGAGISRAGWEIYIAEFERLARQLEISEEGKVRKLFKSLHPNWQDFLIEAQRDRHHVFLTGVPVRATGSQVKMMLDDIGVPARVDPQRNGIGS